MARLSGHLRGHASSTPVASHGTRESARRLGRGIRPPYSRLMRVLLKLELDCTPDAAWRAIRSPAVLREVVAPWLDFDSLEPDGLPTVWPEGRHRVRALAFRRYPAGEEVVDVSYPGGLPSGVQMLRDAG